VQLAGLFIEGSEMQQVECDVECYRNYFLVKFYKGEQFIDFMMYPGITLDLVALREFLFSHEIVTFNGTNYDVPMIAAALTGATCEQLKAYSDSIIVGRVKYWEFYKLHNIPELYDLKHIDIFEVAPGVAIGLKMYMARMHSKTLQDLPIDPAAYVTYAQQPLMTKYCGNDLIGTRELKIECAGRLKLREWLGETYNTNVMSKSDAQISEAVIKAELPFKPQRETYPHGYQFYYAAPDFIQFYTPTMRQVLATVLSTPFTVNDVDQLLRSSGQAPGGEVTDIDGNKIKTGIIIPPEIAGTDIRIGDGVYRLGIGGLHSQEKSAWHRTIEGVEVLSDHDVASYYPSLILLMNMYPKAIGEQFIAIYRAIYKLRREAKVKADQCKKTGDKDGAKHWKTVSDGLKIVLNGAFGKLGSKYSILFAPELLIRTTITGQLALLMLIECLEFNGIPVVSANTDGIVLKTPASKEALRDEIITWWENATGLETEATFYTAIFNRDVNNYIAFKPDGSHKAKGCYGEAGVSPAASPTGKHPDREICSEAVVAFLAHGTPLYTTIMGCQDVRKFVTVRQVKGGGVWDGSGEYLGKTVRWYYGKNSTHAIRYVNNGNQVAGSLGSVPCMVLPDTLPADIDYDHYARTAYSMLVDLGVIGT
jgi:hypothetical protein